MDAYQEVRTLLNQIRNLAPNAKVQKATDQLEVLARAHMEPSPEIPPLGLSRSEGRIFNLLLHKRGKVVQRWSLAEVCAPDGLDPSLAVVDVHISHMRKKLPAHFKIETIWGVGYQLAA
jgi:DNA-binding response OmpR family regulator